MTAWLTNSGTTGEVCGNATRESNMLLSTSAHVQSHKKSASAQGPPPDKWERETADGAGAAKTWGLRDTVLTELADAPTAAMREIHARLARLYPEVDIAHMPAEHMQAHAGSLPAAGSSGVNHMGPVAAQRSMQQHSAAEQPTGGRGAPGQRDCAKCETAAADCSCSPAGRTTSSQAASQAQDSNAPSHVQQRIAGLEGDMARPRMDCAGSSEPDQTAFCAQFVGNAPVAGDTYTWHVDADPSTLPACR